MGQRSLEGWASQLSVLAVVSSARLTVIRGKRGFGFRARTPFSGLGEFASLFNDVVKVSSSIPLSEIPDDFLEGEAVGPRGAVLSSSVGFPLSVFFPGI
jgi:hypothetical protein